MIIKCLTENCNKKVSAKGYCNICYPRLRRNGIITDETPFLRKKHLLSEIDLTQKTAFCLECKTTVKIYGGNNKQNRWRCGIDSARRARDFKRKRRQLKKDQLSKNCEICGIDSNLRWDHDHATGNFRGTLCNLCNTGIGMLKDDFSLCLRASRYLKKHAN